MTLEVIFSSASRADLKKIWQRISEDRPKTAERIFAKIQRRCSSLGDQPRLGPARPEIDAEARGLIIERWIALYRVTADYVEIVRILDGARDLANIDWPSE